jgi:hypothetical protein
MVWALTLLANRQPAVAQTSKRPACAAFAGGITNSPDIRGYSTPFTVSDTPVADLHNEFAVQKTTTGLTKR